MQNYSVYTKNQVLDIYNKLSKLSAKLDKANSLIQEVLLVNEKGFNSEGIMNVKKEFKGITSEINGSILPLVNAKIKRD